MPQKTKTFVTGILAALFYLAMITVNWLAVSLPINGRTPGEISDSLPNLFAPAGITFSIWSVIYTFLGLYTLYQFGVFRNRKSKLSQANITTASKFFVVTSALNIAWIFSWHFGYYLLSVIIMVALLLSLIRINHLLKSKPMSAAEKWLVRAPFSFYFGWITVATIANITAFLVSINWNGWGISDDLWTIIVLVLGAGIGTTVILRNKDFRYGMVLVWAYTGILIKHISDNGFAGQYQNIIITLYILIGLLAIVSIVQALRIAALKRTA